MDSKGIGFYALPMMRGSENESEIPAAHTYPESRRGIAGEPDSEPITATKHFTWIRQELARMRNESAALQSAAMEARLQARALQEAAAANRAYSAQARTLRAQQRRIAWADREGAADDGWPADATPSMTQIPSPPTRSFAD